MKETATILKILEDGTTALLRFHEQEACKSCKSVFCKANERTFTARNDSALELREGDIVTVFLPPGKTIQASFLLLIAPLLLFFLFFFLSEKMFGLETEIIKILFGLGGLVIGFFVSYFVSKGQKNTSMPKIVEKHYTECIAQALNEV